MGAAQTVKVDNQSIKFAEGTVQNRSSFDHRHMKVCKYLNLRNSSFSSVDVWYLENILFIDISNTKIQKADYRSCELLKKIICDVS